MSIGTLNLIHERESVPFERERGYSMMNVLEINQSLESIQHVSTQQCFQAVK